MLLQSTLIVIQQILIVFILIGIGFLAAKFGILGEEGARQITDFLLIIVIPCVIIMAFQTSFEPSLLKNILIAALISALTHAVGILISQLMFRKDPSAQKTSSFIQSFFTTRASFLFPCCGRCWAKLACSTARSSLRFSTFSPGLTESA